MTERLRSASSVWPGPRYALPSVRLEKHRHRTDGVEGSFYPDDEESLRVNRECEAAEKVFKAAKEARDRRQVSLYFNTSRKPFTTYGQAIEDASEAVCRCQGRQRQTRPPNGVVGEGLGNGKSVGKG